MRREATLESVLLYVDGPQLLTVCDRVGTLHLCLLVEQRSEASEFLCVAISRSRLAALRLGELDLRTAFTQPEARDFSLLFQAEPVTLESTVSLESVVEVPESWLPAEGFVLAEFLEHIEENARQTVAAATARNRAVVRIALNPPEARDGPKINAGRLAEALSLWQSLVRYAHRRTLSVLPENMKSFLSGEENYTLEVYGFAEGSFEVLLQSKAPSDLLGTGAVTRALELIDILTARIESPLEALEIAKENRGFVIHAFQNLLRFINVSDMPVVYTWADPQRAAPSWRAIQPRQAGELYELLVAREELGVEEITLVGVFLKADTKRGTWTLRTAEGKEQSGQLAAPEAHALRGVTLETQVYRIACDDRLEETAGTGKQASKLYLRTLTPVTPQLLPDS